MKGWPPCLIPGQKAGSMLTTQMFRSSLQSSFGFMQGMPSGAILPFGGHKGFGIAVFCEVLAGALTGGASSHPSNKTVKRMANNMMTIALDPDAFAGSAFFEADISRLVGWIKSSRPSVSEGQVLIPGEVEVRVRQQRLNSGIPLDQKTTEMLRERTRGFGISHSSLLGQR